MSSRLLGRQLVPDLVDVATGFRHDHTAVHGDHLALFVQEEQEGDAHDVVLTAEHFLALTVIERQRREWHLLVVLFK
ncbi:TPA: hypothetical protein N0F65_001992 [Lagenidium giganteum]|uniref:Uncharacterized protein n=1 Tax=Lagenidium giganteum TaxID=4803 RepID=A0AAV2Z333_9STRA|nr:TPA: hypothetical protein N0F65_001992 [Lagenidium giganteum]